MFKMEKVKESEGIELVKEIGAIFQNTLIKYNLGIEPLFEKIGRKFLNLNKTEKDPNLREENRKKKVNCYIF